MNNKNEYVNPSLSPYLKEGRKGLYIAEIGLNHNGSVETALEMIDLASEAGADMVKFQTFVPELMNSLYTSSLLAGEGCSVEDSSQLDFLASLTLTDEEYAQLIRRCREKEIVFFSAPFDVPSLHFLEKNDVPLYKVASSEVTNHDLLREIALTGKPVILSTGMSTEDEIAEALNIFEAHNGGEVTLLHCVSLYPYNEDEANIQRVASLKKKFGRAVGLSDHSRSHDSALIAASMGAGLFEKHFTIDREHPCPDKDVSLEPESFSQLISSVEGAYRLMGDGKLGMAEREKGTAAAARRSLFAGRDIPAGGIITHDDLCALRPGTGIPPSGIDALIGNKTVTDIPKGVLLTMDMFEKRN